MQAVKRDGTILEIGDEVTTDFRGCVGHEFVVLEIHPWENCESKTLVVVHLKGSPERVIKSPFAGRNGRPQGLDTNWFTKVKTENEK